MEKKKSEVQVRLRLVKTPEAEASSSTEEKEHPRFRSAFAQGMSNFADELDKMIEDIKCL